MCVCFAEELKALEYGFPSTFDEFSDRRYQIIFKLKFTRVWHDNQANSNYYQSRENDVAITGICIKFWGRGLPIASN